MRWILTFTAIFSATTLAGIDCFVAIDGDDANPGTKERPWRTIQKAANTAPPGSQVNIKGGTYYEKIAVNVEGNSSTGAIVFQNFHNEKVVLSGEGIASNEVSYTDDIIYIEDKSYITIKGLEIRDVHAPEASGVRFVGGGSHIEIRDCEIHEIRGGGPEGGAMAITIFGTNDEVPIENVIIDNNHIHHCDPANSEALTINGNVRKFEVTNNVVHDVNNIGIDFIGGETWVSSRHARDGVCRGNVVYRARHSQGFAAGIYVDGGNNIVVEDNEVYECDLGIEVGAENKGTEARAIIVRNNYLHDNRVTGLVFGGFNADVGRVANCTFTNNRLKNNDLANTGHGELWIQWAGNNTVSHNSFHPSQNERMLYTEPGAKDNTLDFDDFCPNDGIENAIFVWKGIEYKGLASFQEASGQETHATVCTVRDE